MLYSLFRPLLFTLDPEAAHTLSLSALQHLQNFGLLPSRSFACKSRRIMGLDFPNPVGLAAGLDKNGDYIDVLAKLGFGFIEVGTVTPRPQPGNPRPRLFRLPQAQAIINRMGFNNHGIDYLIENIKRSNFQGILGVNIGKNFDTPLEKAAEDYLICFQKTYRYASYVTINISSPNTRNLRQLQNTAELERLLHLLKTEQTKLSDQYGKYTPLVIKIAPDMESSQLEAIAQQLIKYQIDGVIATNTTISRQNLEHLPLSSETGGLSGAPLKLLSTEVIRKLHALLQETIPIIGVGGIMSAEDAKEKIEAGANLIQLYTGLIYHGPDLIRQSVEAICTFCHDV
ncbi:quinone-dependent dihydroorotate dehydrogenase [Nitrosomonas sp. Is37]|uniref:quinone-dependent dihydroorotate dehydrogenase n=1 Tax=Nitrosomonas sp. Is37 TaxID=3080535 RepID=UPI00294B7AA4|nr:quinone-dependent dihydroorotate dehydrogenase [Nitrosomonas sp. Is37]MDV6345447.1 quinone-dependent dihydroorotate dehydrogenase [Nitrosomonas sp. Is37]